MALTSTQRDQLTTLFITMFNAVPGATVLSSLVDAREAGASLEDIASALASKPQFKQLYPSVMAAEDVAERVVATLLPDAVRPSAKAWALNWVVERLAAGDRLGSVLLQASQALSTSSNPNYDSAKAQLANKLEVANYYSVTLLKSGDTLTELQSLIKDVTADPASVTAAKNLIDNPGEEEPDDGEPVEPPPPINGDSQSLTKSATAGTSYVVEKTTADKVMLTLTTIELTTGGNNGDVDYADVTLDSGSDPKQLSITLIPVTDTNGTTSTQRDDVLDKVWLTLSTNGTNFADLESLKLSGNGKATIINGEGSALIHIDASGLVSKTADGAPDDGLILTSANPLAETILLSGGKDKVVLDPGTSTYGATDVISGLNLVDDASTSGRQLDEQLSDDIQVDSSSFVKVAFSSSSFTFALIAAAKSTAGDAVVFQFGGNTYIYADNGADVDELDDSDLLVKLVGTVNLDLLVDALNN